MSAPRTLTKAEILGADDIRRVAVPVPEWGGEGAQVLVRMLTGTERDAWEAGLFTSDGGVRRLNQANFRPRLCALVICDEQGSRLFSDEEIAALGAKSSEPILRVYEAAAKLNRLTAEDKEQLGKS